jgi:16S rRNA processing protein RimM
LEKSDGVLVGRIIKAFGYKGELIVQIGKEFISIITKEGFLFIETDEELVPFFIESFDEGDKDLHNIRFEDIDNVTHAKEFTGNTLWMPLTSLPEEFTEQNPLIDIRGFQVIDRNYGEVGIADEVFELSQQIILRIYKGNKEILLPVNDKFILKTDRKKRQIHIEAPDGLIESYLTGS